MGARPMARIVKEKLKKPLANEILFGDLSTKGGKVVVSVKDGDLKIKVEPNPGPLKSKGKLVEEENN